jgi:nicotinamidase-related amidase
MAEFQIEPGNIALIVHDLQKVFLQGPFAPRDSQAYVKRIKRLIDLCRSKRIPVIYTKACFRRDGADMGLLGEFFEGLKSRATLIEDQKDSEILDELAPLKDDLVIRKGNSYSAFYNTPLENILKNLGVDAIVVVGGSSNVGIDSLARDALSRGIKTVLLEDATYALDLPDMGWGAIPQAVLHKTFLSNFAFCLGQVMRSEDFISRVS